MRKILLSIFFFCITLFSHAQRGNLWTKINGDTTLSTEKVERKSMPNTYLVYALDLNLLKSQLAAAPSREDNKRLPGITIPFPKSDGTIANYSVYEASIMHPDLAKAFPDIKSYVGIGIEDPTTTIRFSTTLFGLHTMTLSGTSASEYIDTYTKDFSKCIVYSRKDIINPGDFECSTKGNEIEESSFRNSNSTQSNAGVFRKYRIAISTTIEYSAFHINRANLNNSTETLKRAAVLAAINVTLTRVNGVYEKELAVTLQLVPNNSILINIVSDNFTNNEGIPLLAENQAFVDQNIGNANYDIGHVFSTGGGGVAGYQSLCNPNSKARGVTGSGSPVNDPFNIDYVAHEVGHQFGGSHTFRSNLGFCNGNVSASTSVEPGSGTTIMAYAGICSSHNVQNNSDAYFNTVSLSEIESHITGGGSCGVNTAMSNNAPSIGVLNNYTIPKSTPFILTGNATDSDGNALTYAWEQIDNESATMPPTSTTPSGPVFRSRTPSTSPSRYFPPLENVIAGNLAPAWEVVPSVARVLDFAFTVRDNDAVNGGQTARKDIAVNVSSVAGPFTVTAPNTSLSWAAGSNQTVTWNVSGTTGNGINCQFVDIYLSTNSGTSFPILLASKVPNDGSEVISVPNSTGASNRIMIKGSDHIFYDVSNTNFTITSVPSPTFSISMDGTPEGQSKSGCIGSNIVYTFNYETIGGFSGNTTFAATGLPGAVSVAFSPTPINSTGPVTMTLSNTGSLSDQLYPFTVTATSGATSKIINFYLQAITPEFAPSTLLTPANNSEGLSQEVNLVWVEDSFGATSYDVQVATDAGFTTIVRTTTTDLSNYLVSGLDFVTDYFWRIRPRNAGCGGNFSAAFKFKTGYCDTFESVDVPLAISTSGTPTVNSTLTIDNSDNVVISDVNVTLNISHTFIRDLTARLISPSGTQITLFSNICANEQGHQNAVATFDDSSTVTVSCSVTNPAITGKLIPSQPLSILNGTNSQGTWTLRISDSSNDDGGTINSWSLNFCSLQVPLDVENPTSLTNFKVYPNPNNGSFTIQSDKIGSDKVSVSVYDMQGRIIFENNFASNGNLNQNIQLTNAQAGVYLLSVSDGNKKEVKRIIVQ